ncbi:MAG: NifB/NifX family molybdenum-iron cluster-binding protein [Candidatus Eisenbacteria sp.]|nr:NifB/NifX family molybdenum-iron cluster-binding protein [Candidatus Eisenbacteria bacterium]
MKLAIPLFGTRVSPRFDCAGEFLVAEVEGGRVVDRRVQTVDDAVLAHRIQRLVDRGIALVVCGGIDRFSAAQLALQGIQVVPWITGEADDALQCFLNGELEPRMMMGHGGRCRGRWQFRQGGYRGGSGRGGPRGRWGRHGERSAPTERS